MCLVSKRVVKGKTYYYLEESFKRGKKWVKESIYLGPEKPGNEALLEAFDELKKKCGRKKHAVLVPPLTEFIPNKKALQLQAASEKKKKFLRRLTELQREDFVRRERITFITDSNAIEGSSLNYSETSRIIGQEKEIKKYEKKNIIVTGIDREEQEALNLKACLDRYDKYMRLEERLSEKMILQLHYILLDRISGYEKYQGIYRPVKVYIAGSEHEFPLPQEVPGMMKGLVQWLGENEKLVHPAELAAKFHTKFTGIHPFADGNGRMARLLMNYILQQKGFPFTNIPLKRRAAYMKTQAAGNINNHKPFTGFLAEEIVRQHLKSGKKINAAGGDGAVR
ncbi:MAG: Fic family protein [Candidatus Diapherotrites archaeon]